VRLEETAIEKWYGAELPRHPASVRPGLVQSAEEEWPQEIAVDTAAPAETTVNFLGQKLVSLPEPAFTLDEIEKEDAGQLEQDKRVPICSWHGLGESRGHPIERSFELPEETPSHWFG
jgi:hypothetical protein